MILINNDLIWVSIPRCASRSIEKALLNSNLKTEYAGDFQKKLEIELKDSRNSSHTHMNVLQLYNYFGVKDTICIKRDWLDRWFSALSHLWTCILKDKLTPIINFEDVDNDFIYKNFDNDFANRLYFGTTEDVYICYSKFVKEDISYLKKESKMFASLKMFLSQDYWKNFGKCTYEFDIKEIDKFEKFIEQKYNVEFSLPKINISKNINNNIIIDDKLKNWIWKAFESLYNKEKRLL